MTQSLHPAAQQGFSAAAELYQQVRPDYPADLSPWLAETLSLPVDANLVDLGTGTGKFIPYLRPLSSHITAIDPVPEMLAQLKLAHPDIHTLEGMSHQLPLPDHSVNAVFCAQSFHWFANLETLKELDRVLKPQAFWYWSGTSVISQSTGSKPWQIILHHWKAIHHAIIVVPGVKYLRNRISFSLMLKRKCASCSMALSSR
ncbi:class I SAM-dependent methyltransferase [Acinetobacter variabilis]|nr:class I SAM-dependent methyltransferase [Acinetobacter variabilis]UXI51177.1 class I SAM-dependent methyltransferase [Acinetobacter variabilis]